MCEALHTKFVYTESFGSLAVETEAIALGNRTTNRSLFVEVTSEYQFSKA